MKTLRKKNVILKKMVVLKVDVKYYLLLAYFEVCMTFNVIIVDP